MDHYCHTRRHRHLESGAAVKDQSRTSDVQPQRVTLEPPRRMTRLRSGPTEPPLDLDVGAATGHKMEIGRRIVDDQVCPAEAEITNVVGGGGDTAGTQATQQCLPGQRRSSVASRQLALEMVMGDGKWCG
jgi:hypothetical protein